MKRPSAKSAWTVAGCAQEDEKTIRARTLMVDEQIVGRGVLDQGVLREMREIPRHLFVPDEERDYAYSDGPLPLGFGQTISQPYIVALMTEALALRGDEKVLEIGTGSGYQSAILSRLAAQVCSIELVEELARTAEERLARLGIFNVTVIIGDGGMGLPEKAPFHAIIVTAAAPEIPRPLVEQLAVGGRMVLPVGEPGTQSLLKLTKKKDGLEEEYLGLCAFVPLVGRCRESH